MNVDCGSCKQLSIFGKLVKAAVAFGRTLDSSQELMPISVRTPPVDKMKNNPSIEKTVHAIWLRLPADPDLTSQYLEGSRE